MWRVREEADPFCEWSAHVMVTWNQQSTCRPEQKTRSVMQKYSTLYEHIADYYSTNNNKQNRTAARLSIAENASLQNEQNEKMSRVELRVFRYTNERSSFFSIEHDRKVFSYYTRLRTSYTRKNNKYIYHYATKSKKYTSNKIVKKKYNIQEF